MRMALLFLSLSLSGKFCYTNPSLFQHFRLLELASLIVLIEWVSSGALAARGLAGKTRVDRMLLSLKFTNLINLPIFLPKLVPPSLPFHPFLSLCFLRSLIHSFCKKKLSQFFFASRL